MKRTIWVLCALLLVSAYAAADHTFTYDQVKGGLMITGCTVDQAQEIFIVPEEIDGEPVVALRTCSLGASHILDGALTQMKHMVLPSTLQHIEDSSILGYYGTIEVPPENEWYSVIDGYLVEMATGKAIYSAPPAEGYVDTLIVPDEIKVLGRCLFGPRHNFRTIQLPDGLQRIGAAVFSESFSLQEIVIPDSVQVIEDYAFLGCIELERVVFPADLVLIGEDAFVHCWSLTSIDLPDKLRVIDEGAFDIGNVGREACETTLNLSGNLLYIGENAFRGRKVDDLTIPQSVVYVGEGAFAY